MDNSSRWHYAIGSDMVLPTDLFRVLYTFDLGLDGEVAATGFHCRYAAGDLTLQESAEALAPHALSAWVTGFAPRTNDFPSSVRLSKVGVYHVIPGPGHTDAFSVVLTAAGGPDTWQGGASSSLPWECALVATLECIPIGEPPIDLRRKRGRMYLPPMSPEVITNTAGFIDSGKQGQMITAVTATLEAFNDEVVSTQARVVVVSRKGGFATDVDRVSMDAQVDLQKRRENRQSIPPRLSGATLDA